MGIATLDIDCTRIWDADELVLQSVEYRYCIRFISGNAFCGNTILNVGWLKKVICNHVSFTQSKNVGYPNRSRLNSLYLLLWYFWVF